MNVLAITPPPVSMPTPPTAEHVVLAILGVLVGLAFVGALYIWWRTGKPTALLLTLGGLVCSLNESAVDVLGHCYFPRGGWEAQELLGRPIPVWVLFGYILFFGAFVYVMAEIMKRRPSRRSMWIGIGVFWVANAVLELPILSTHLYIYYGDQPLAVGGFPLVWLTINCLGSFAAAVVVVRFEGYFRGWRQLLLLGLCYATYMGTWSLAMPYFWAVDSGSGAVRSAGAILSMVLGVIAIDALMRIGLRGPAVESAAGPSGAGSEIDRTPVAY
ncbi:hypothetical protein [Nocardia miyunensis]|uniref:hypothetical protein n=1 Tax=Nocardia miyunensis TaxID=282684 RepID=UPI000836DE57|nr:hypothetical protein [Nocardia miyunensis]